MALISKYLLCMGLVALLFSCSGNNDNHMNKGGHCKDESTCANDPNCMCWCSVKCGFRKKTPQDMPVFVDDDSNGKHCYCKQWDLDHYEDNCIEHKNLKEPVQE